MKVLIIDDEPQVASVLGDICELEDIDYEIITDSKKAIEVLKENFYDLVFCDVRMPSVTGDLVLREVSKTQKNFLNWYFVSGFSDLSVDEAKKLGAKDILAKPFKFDEIRAILKKSTNSP